MKTVQEVLRRQVEDHQAPSVQYAFFDTDTIISHAAHGVRNVGKQIPVDSKTTMHLFSVTKTFTALAVLQLAQQGKLELQREVVAYLPEFTYDRRITIQQLLDHSSGIPNPLPLNWIHTAEEHSGFQRDIFFGNLFKKYRDLDFEPGTKFQYSNLGYVILGKLIERVSGQSYESFIKTSILDKSGIRADEIGFTLNPGTDATGYHRWASASNLLLGLLIDKGKFMDKKEGRWKPFVPFYINGISYGGMMGSMNGLVKYGQALMKDSLLLNDKYMELLLCETNIGGKATGMSLSWFTGSLKNHRYYAHAGGGGGFYVELRVYPELGVGSVIMYNRSGMKDEKMLSHLDGFFIIEKQ